MSNCLNCGAALPPDSLVCSYCKTRQDIDLKSIHPNTTGYPESDRICPRCQKPMPVINLPIAEKFLVERCPSCLGIFFDNGELEATLEKSVALSFEVDHPLLEKLQGAMRRQDYPVTYIKCPVCQKFMNRINYGSRSGVIVDTCKNHGIWLDGGELRQLMEWLKAGGDLHHKRNQLEIERLKLIEQQQRLQQASIAAQLPGTFDSHHSRWANDQDWDFLTRIGRLLSRFLK